MTFRFIILAAGKGSRMKSELPKALIPIGGKPILQHLYESVQASGVDGVPVIVVGHERDQLCAQFGGVCEYVVQEEQLGTAHAVKVCRDVVNNADAIIVLYGDHPFVSARTLRDLALMHEKSETVLTLMTTTVPSFHEWPIYFHWGRIIRDKHGHIMAIREYKDAMESEQAITEVNPALYCFDTSWLWKHIGQIKNINAKKEFYLTDLIELAVAQGHEIASMSIPPEEAVGINTPEEREIAEAILAKRHGIA
ncbi:NTP transferase domain-containing protein [Candidatus Uhrbacteria bacterium]|nr:NTP transferase domain-containing protein [Candidatus Uhrbacteria bacterium]